ncbi:MAG TPA: hypothetical protein VHC72_19290, partial [Bryobacteraceae bacterium]|nr:hypothetical protein [Bryobacteraceae bacterium]
EALLKYASEPEGLPRLVHADREQEARAMAHGAGARALLRMATISTFGLYRHEDSLTPGKLTQMAARRRASFSKRNGTLPDSGAIEAGE